MVRYLFRFYSLIAVMLLLSSHLHAQMFTAPPGVSGLGANAFPWNTTAVKRLQAMYPPGSFVPTPNPVLINKLYFQSAGSSTGPTWNNITITLIQTNDTVWANGNTEFVSGGTVVFSSPSYTYPTAIAINDWFSFNLTTPFVYNPTQTLFVDIKIDGVSLGVSTRNISSPVGTSPKRLRAPNTTDLVGTPDQVWNSLGFDGLPVTGTDAAAFSLISPIAPVSLGTPSNVAFNIANFAANTITSATVGYQLNNNPPVIEAWSGNIATTQQSPHFFTTPVTLPTGQNSTLKVWVTNPNGSPDINLNNDTLTTNFCPPLSGSYTIGGANPDFASLNDAIAAMQCGGVAGPTILNLSNGTYTGNFSFSNITGAGLAAPITLQSLNGNRDSVILVSPGSGTTLTVTGIEGFTLANLTVSRTNVPTAQEQALNLTGSNNSNLLNCVFNAPLGSVTTLSTSRNVTIASSSFVFVSGCKFVGGYYGVYANGASVTARDQFVSFSDNTFEDQRFYGAYFINHQFLDFSNNTIHNLDSTNVSAYHMYVGTSKDVTISNNYFTGSHGFYTLFLTNLDGNNFEPNRIFNNVFAGKFFSTTTPRSIYISGASTNGLDQFELVNNSFNMEYNSTSTTQNGLVYIIGGTATAPVFNQCVIANNSFRVFGNVPANTRYYYIGNQSMFDSTFINNNNYDESTVGTFAYSASPVATFNNLTAWQTTTRDNNAYSGNPGYATNNLLIPVSVQLNNRGIPFPYVSTDILGLARDASNPDIGAYEFSVLAGAQIVYNVLGDTVLAPNRIISATITDSTSTVSKAYLYYKVSTAGAYSVDSTPVISGSTYTFTFNYASIGAVAGTTLEYYIVARNAAGTSVSNPFGATGTNGNIPPPGINSFSLLPQLAGNYRVGVSDPTATYPTITAALAAYNSGLITAPVTFQLVDTLYSANETFPLVINNNTSSTATNSVRIVPFTGVNATIRDNSTLSNSAVIIFQNASNFEIDGSNNGTSTRNLTIEANSTATNVGAVLFRRTAGELNNLALRNTNVIGASNTTTTHFGIVTAPASISASAVTESMNGILVENNQVSRAYTGIYMRGSTVAGTGAGRNIRILRNDVGNSDPNLMIRFHGIDVTNLDSAVIAENEVHDMIVTSGTQTIEGIYVGGSAGWSQGNRISRNKVYNIQQLDIAAAAGRGAYGINLLGGNGHIVDNNVIYGVRTTNGSNVSTITFASGIRITTGTGHKLYYNSVNMTGAYSNTNATTATSAAFTVTSTVVTGLELVNNVFANSMTTNATTGVFFTALWLPTSYPASGITVNHNGYYVSNSAQHFVARVGTATTSPTYVTVADWKVFSQSANPNNDIVAVPFANANAPFTSATDLTIPATTTTPLEGNGFVIADLGIPNIDHNGVNRPAFGATSPDIGAYEFNGVSVGDILPPVIDSVRFNPDSSLCATTPRTVTAYVRDNSSGIDSVFIVYTIGTANPVSVLMTQTSGTSLNGVFTGTIPAAPAPGLLVSFGVNAVDSNGNPSAILAGGSYTDDYLAVNAGPDQLVNLGDTAVLTVGSGALNSMLITEVILFRTGTGTSSVYPPYAVGDDFIELTNVGNAPVNISGWRLQVVSASVSQNRDYTFPANVVVPANGVVLLSPGAGTDVPASLYFNMNGASNNSWGSGAALGVIMRNTQNNVVDAVPLNTYAFVAADSVPATEWIGPGAPSPSGNSGTVRTGFDTNTAADWSGSAVVQTTTGFFNPGLGTVLVGGITWNTTPVQTTPTITVGPFAAFGTFPFIATITDGVCSSSDTVNVLVSGPGQFDLIPPTIDTVISSIDNDACDPTSRTITANVTENTSGSGLSTVTLRTRLNGVLLPGIITMTQSSGNSQAGVFTATVPPVPNRNDSVRYEITAADSNQNLSPIKFTKTYVDGQITGFAGNDTLITAGDTATLIASVVGFGTSGVLQANQTAGTSCGGGFMMDVTVGPKPLKIDGFDVWPQTTGTQTVEVFYKLGSKTGNQSNQSAWISAGSYTLNAATATLQFMPINGFVLQANTAYAIYLNYNNQYATGSTTFSNGDLSIGAGEGLCTPWTACCDPRVFAGAIHYSSSVNISWRELGTTPILGTSDTLQVTPTVTTQYLLTSTDSTCFHLDTVTVFVGSSQLIDIEVSRLVSPVSGAVVNAATPVEVVLRNNGNVATGGFNVIYTVNGATIQSSTYAQNINPGDSVNFTFSTPWLPSQGGNYEICVLVNGVFGDNNNNNDTLCANISSSVNVRNLGADGPIAKLYPNPAQQHLMLELNQPVSDGWIYIYDVVGKLMQSINLEAYLGNTELNIDLTTLADGVYNLQLNTSKGVQTIRFVKTK